MKRLCLIIALCLSGCSNTVTKLDLSSQKEDIFNTTIVFIEKKLPVTVEGYNTSSISGDVLTRAMGGAILGVKHAFDEDRMLDVCASCADFDFNKPVRESFLEIFQTLDWMRNQNFCVVDNYKKAKQEIKKIKPGSLYIVITAHYSFDPKFINLTGFCELELYKYNKNFDPNKQPNRRKNRIANSIYSKNIFEITKLEKYNFVFGIDKNAKQWHGKLPQHIEKFAKSFAQRYFNELKG